MAKHLGEFEILVLLALVRLDPDAYGVTIREDIEAQTGRRVTVGALYATLNRLETKAYVRASMGEATPERGGRAKRYFQITPKGREKVEQSISALRNMLKDTPIGSGSGSL